MSSILVHLIIILISQNSMALMCWLKFEAGECESQSLIHWTHWLLLCANLWPCGYKTDRNSQIYELKKIINCSTHRHTRLMPAWHMPHPSSHLPPLWKVKCEAKTESRGQKVVKTSISAADSVCRSVSIFTNWLQEHILHPSVYEQANQCLVCSCYVYTLYG